MARCTLYRYFDRYNHLLYVGITGSGSGRMHGHSSSSRWWGKVHHSTFKHYRTRELAAAAEIEAIKAERPRYNIMHRAWGIRPLYEVFQMLDAIPPKAQYMPTRELAHILAIENTAVLKACRAQVFEHVVIGRLYLVRLENLKRDLAWWVDSRSYVKFIY